VKVFLSWSGQKSKRIAVALRDWLPSVIQEIEAFMSERDIAAGVRWLNEIDQQLEGTNFAIVCVTRDNQSAPWLNFEAGAVAKVIDEARVVPLAIDLKLADVKPPLGHFQAKDISKSGIMAVLEALNVLAERPVSNLAAACDKWWPDLEPKLASAATEAESSAPVREERELLEEILATVRSWTDPVATYGVTANNQYNLDLYNTVLPYSSVLGTGADAAVAAVADVLPPHSKAEMVSTTSGVLIRITTPTALPQRVVDQAVAAAKAHGFALMLG
jgi:TIR domain